MRSELNERRKKPNESCRLEVAHLEIVVVHNISLRCCYKVIQRWLGLPGDSDIYFATERLQYEAYRLTSDISTKEFRPYWKGDTVSLTPFS